MTSSDTPSPAPANPALRRAAPADYPDFARLFAELGVPEPPPARDDWVAGMMARTVFVDAEPAPEADIDAEPGRSPVAFAFYDVMRKSGYVRNLAVAREHRRAGWGRAMMAALAEVFREQGCTEWRLNVEEGNTAAIALYRSCGLEPLYRTTSLSMPLDRVDRLPTPPATVRVAPLPEHLDPEVEAQFDMPEGLLTSLRTRAGVHLWQLLDDSHSPARCVGAARFTPSFPGAFPFKLERPETARVFLDAMLPELARVSPEVTYVNLACEDDPALVAVLRAAGATPLMEIIHMRGSLVADA